MDKCPDCGETYKQVVRHRVASHGWKAVCSFTHPRSGRPCPEPHSRHGWCGAHATQVARGGSPSPLRKKHAPGDLCAFRDCDRERLRHAWCQPHAKQAAKGVRMTTLREPGSHRGVCTFTDAEAGDCGKPEKGRGFCQGHLVQLRTRDGDATRLVPLHSYVGRHLGWGENTRGSLYVQRDPRDLSVIVYAGLTTKPRPYDRMRGEWVLPHNERLLALRDELAALGFDGFVGEVVETGIRSDAELRQKERALILRLAAEGHPLRNVQHLPSDDALPAEAVARRDATLAGLADYVRPVGEVSDAEWGEMAA